MLLACIAGPPCHARICIFPPGRGILDDPLHKCLKQEHVHFSKEDTRDQVSCHGVQCVPSSIHQALRSSLSAILWRHPDVYPIPALQIATGKGALGQLQLELGLPSYGVDLLVLGILGYSLAGAFNPATYSESNQRDVKKRNPGETTSDSTRANVMQRSLPGRAGTAVLDMVCHQSQHQSVVCLPEMNV
jgi:hypothetical protein